MIFPVNSHAVEGGMGRSVSGTTINPYMAIVPPEPGFVFSVGDIYYSGDIGGTVPVPVGANLALDLKLKANFTNLSLTYIWDTPPSHWNFASGVAVPIAWLDAEANVSVGGITRRREEDNFGLFDLGFVPLAACYHISETEHLGFSFTVCAPTGEYDPSSLTSLSLNNWTFIPGFAYTKISSGNIEFSFNAALQFYTENHATNYQNGVVTDVEALVIKRLPSGWGFGLVGSWLDQLNDDSGPTADALHGFNGHALGIGPILTYAKTGSPFSLNLRWIHEFACRNMTEGNVFAINLSYEFATHKATK